nr:coiled-coil domain-containing protein 40 [Misgurnus anguillicaudatus]
MEGGGSDEDRSEYQMNEQEETLARDIPTEQERNNFEMIFSQSGLIELSDSHDGGTDHFETSGPVLLSNSAIDNTNTPVRPQQSDIETEWIVGEQENEQEQQLVVMDPEHPLMKRFQAALKNNLSNKLERLNFDLREKRIVEKAEVQRHQELAEEVYMVQEMLAKLQGSLEANHESNAQAASQRRQAQDELDAVKDQYQAVGSQAHKQRTQVSELQSKVDSMALVLLFMQKSNSDLRLDIQATINASNKAQKERIQAEEHKHEQDFYLDRLTKHVEKLSEQIALYEVQITAQREETKAAMETLSEAQLEVDSLFLERKQLFQQWNSSLVMMRRRDEAYNSMQEELTSANDQMRFLESEINGYKTSITQEEEQNEQLTLHQNRAQTDCTTSRKLITQSQNHQGVLQAQYSTYAQMTQETEKTLSMLRVEHAMYESKLKAFRKQTERESAVWLELQDQVMNKLQERFTHENAAKYSCRLTDKTTAQSREKEAELIKLENGINAVKLEGLEAVTRLNSLAALRAELEQEMSQLRLLLSSHETEISRHMADIERKQSVISLFNKKIKEIVSNTGLEDLGPLEICAASLCKELEEIGAEVKEQQQLWLWQQGELVRFTEDKQAHNSSLHTLRTQLTILQQTKMRRESEMEQDQRELEDLESQIKAGMADLMKISSLLSKNSDLNQALQQSNSLMEKEFRLKLKEAERELIETQLKLERLNKDKEEVVNRLVEAERLLMLWEKRTQLMQETLSAIDSDIGQGEIQTLRKDIHRMEVRYAQLIKQQERLLRDMELVVAMRETIMIRGEAQVQSDRMQPTHTEYHHIFQRLRQKISQTKRQSEESGGIIAQLEERRQSLSSSLREKQMHLGDLQNTRSVLFQDLGALQETKERNLSRLLTLQSQGKHLQDVKVGRYRTVASEDTALQQTKEKLETRLSKVDSILQQLTREVPQHYSTFHRLNLILKEHLHNGFYDS